MMKVNYFKPSPDFYLKLSLNPYLKLSLDPYFKLSLDLNLLSVEEINYTNTLLK
jgi:hypothetical protein